MINSDARRQLQDMGLDIKAIAEHQDHVLRQISSHSPRVFRIFDTCRLDNGGIRRLPETLVHSDVSLPVVAFVPAAGASSRYLAPLVPLMAALRASDAHQCAEALDALTADGYLNCPLPTSVLELVAYLENSRDVVPGDLASRVLAEIDAPKALYPAVLDGATFLSIKRMEHDALDNLAGEVYICPPGRVSEFLERADAKNASSTVRCYEQGAGLATTRFEADGRVALDSAGHVSMVPGGHGSLLRLLPRVAEDFKGARGVFIRNIDNVAGVSTGATEAANSFLLAFNRTLAQMDEIRRSIEVDDSVNASVAAKRILDFWGITVISSEPVLTTLMIKLFHANPGSVETRLFDLCRRPLVLMGQVPNTARDVGGTCVFTEIDGVRQKLCLEVPHATDADKKKFLEDPSKATHFNPVFVAAEIPNEASLKNWDNHPFWLVAKKSWQGRDTYYQESILYEMLGSSHYANVIFVEVPRLVFNPHKTLKDAGSKTLKNWT